MKNRFVEHVCTELQVEKDKRVGLGIGLIIKMMKISFVLLCENILLVYKL